MVDNVILSKNNLVVTIDTEPTDEENLTKTITIISEPKSTGEQESNPASGDYGPNTTKILDLLSKVEQRITIDGFLSNGTVSGDTSSTAVGRKADLKNIFLGGGEISMTYEGSTFTVNMDKLSIRRVPVDNNTGIDGVVEFSVKFTCIRGEDLTD
jgi:hypothetical protein